MGDKSTAAADVETSNKNQMKFLAAA